MFKKFVKSTNFKILVIAAIVILYTVIALSMAVFYSIEAHKEFSKIRSIEIDYSKLRKKPPARPVFFHILNGSQTENEQDALVVPFAVVIDNTANGRPQKGIENADIVFELAVEGGVTRLLAFFDSSKINEEIGPVRSARLYMNDFARGHKALFAHAGGSPSALVDLQMNQLSVVNVDEIGPLSRYFWRRKDRQAPFNLFTSSERLNQALQSLNINWGQKLVYENNAWTYETTTQNSTSTVSQRAIAHPKIEINFSTSSYLVEYEYNEHFNSYLRSQGGSKHYTSLGKQVQVHNVIIAVMDTTIVDKVGRLQMQTLGSGEAFVCVHGTCQFGTWEKPQKDARIHFFINGEPAKLTPGITWIHVVSTRKDIVF